MSRIMFNKGGQKKFLNEIHKKRNVSWYKIADICNICDRTLRDWRREKYRMNYESIERVSGVLNVAIPKKTKKLPEYWHTRKAGKIGGIKRNKIYGNPGTPEGRRKGGKVTQKKFRANPRYAKKLGFKITKQIAHPKKSSLLAEFIGIVLGDGTISEYQIKISTNRKTDAEHAHFITKVIADLFRLKANIAIRKKNTIDVVISSKSLVEFLLIHSLKKGNKIIQKANVPEWVFKDKEFMKGCLRGLVDTDGGIYFHNHITKGIRYRHMGLCFTSKSPPLLNSAYRMFMALNINAKNDRKSHIFIYNRQEISKYMKIVGSHNPKHIRRFKSYKDSKFFPN